MRELTTEGISLCNVAKKTEFEQANARADHRGHWMASMYKSYRAPARIRRHSICDGAGAARWSDFGEDTVVSSTSPSLASDAL